MKKMKAEKAPVSAEEYERLFFLKVAEKLKEVRASTKLPIDKFAYAHGLQRTTYHKMEQGKPFQMATLIKLLRSLGITWEDFFKGL